MNPQPVLPVVAARCAVAAAAVLALTACGSPADDAGAASDGAPAPAAASTTAATGDAGAPDPAPEAAPTSEPEVEETDAPVATDPVPDTAAPAATDVVLSFAGWVDADSAIEAAGYVSPVVEDGGTCTLLLTSGDRQARATSSGAADASTTACGGLVVDGSELASGTWTAVLQYSSATAEGTSEPLEVEVP